MERRATQPASFLYGRIAVSCDRLALALRKYYSILRRGGSNQLCFHGWLALRAPETGSRIFALLSRFNRSSTSSARFSAAAIHPQTFLTVGPSSGSAHTCVSCDLVARSRGYVRDQEFPGCFGETGEFFAVQLRHQAKWIDAACEADLRFENVSQPGHDRLFQQCLANGQVSMS
jgi:hypothetical protein